MPRKSRYEAEYETLLRRNIALSRQVDHLSVLREIGLAVNASLELNETLPVIANVVQGALDIRRLTIYELEKGGTALRPVIAKYGDDLIGRERLAEDSLQVAGSEAEEAVRSHQVVLTNTPDEDRAYVPLITKNDVFGVMVLEDRRDVQAFNKEDAELFRQIGYQIAIAINNAHLYAMAVTDGLTGLYVRRYFDLRMEEEFEQARRYGRTFSLLLFDIDHFKKFNDAHGHQTGDEVLKQFAALLRENTRKADICCRYGGEEMAVVLPSTNLGKAAVLADKLCAKVREHVFHGTEKNELHVTTSIGVGEFSDRFSDAANMVRAVDQALYTAKDLGRNRVVTAGHS
jgi:diguanylate cyclase (GGDEF)-like protein